MATAAAKLAVLRRAAQPRDENGRWTHTGGLQAVSQVRKEIYKSGLMAAATAATGGLPLQGLATSVAAAGVDAGMVALSKKVVSSKEADAVLASAGKTIVETEHSPMQAKIAKAIHGAIDSLPEIAAKVGTTQLLSHGIHAGLMALNVDPATSHAISNIAAAGLEPGVRQGANYLVQRFKQKRGKYATVKA